MNANNCNLIKKPTKNDSVEIQGASGNLGSLIKLKVFCHYFKRKSTDCNANYILYKNSSVSNLLQQLPTAIFDNAAFLFVSI